MVNLDNLNHPWENDLAEATFVSAYSEASGKIMKEGKLTDGPLKDWWAKSRVVGSNRSGIGITREDRRQLQRLIQNFEKENNPRLIESINRIIGEPEAPEKGLPEEDVLQRAMQHLNNNTTQKNVKANAKALTQAIVEYVLRIRRDAEEITGSLQGN